MSSLRPRNSADFLRIARRHKYAIILPALVAAVSSILAIWQTVPTWESSASIVPETSFGATSAAETIAELARSNELLEAVLTEHESVREAETLAGSIASMRSRIRVETQENGASAATFRISYRSQRADVVHTATKALVEKLTATPEKIAHSNSPDTESLRRRAAELTSRLSEIERTRAEATNQAASKAAGIQHSPQRGLTQESSRLLQTSFETLKDQRYKVEQQLADLDRRIAAQRQIVEAQKGSTTSLRDNPTYALLVTRRAEFQGQRDNLINRQELTEKHPRVLAITDQITAINNQIEELRRQEAGSVRQSPEARELLAISSDRRRLQLELEVIGRELARRASSANAVQQPVSRPVSSTASPRLDEEYRKLLQEQVEVNASLQKAESSTEQSAGAKGYRLRVLEPAGSPQVVPRSRDLLFAILTSAAGLALGACFALALDSRSRSTIQGAADVEHYARLPLLAAVPRTISKADSRKVKTRSRLLLTTSVGIAIVAAFALTRLIIEANVLEIISSR
jgi:hypothetical protein